MALIKFGVGFAGASGKVAGTVYARNRSGAYARNWAKPVNPVTVLQTEVRTRLNSAAATWQVLANSDVDSWNAYAATMTRLNRIGESYVPTGRQIFIETFMNLSQAGIATLSNPGPTTVAPSIKNAIVNAGEVDGTEISTLTISAVSQSIPSGTDPADCKWVVFSAPTHSIQKNNVNKQRRVLLIEDGGDLASLNIQAAYVAYFGIDSAVGRVIDFWFKYIDAGTGLASAEMKVSYTLTAA